MLADTLHVGEGVRRENNGQAVLGDHAHQLLEQREARDGIEIRHRLVEEHQLGTLAERKAGRDVRALTAGQRSDLARQGQSEPLYAGERIRRVPPLVQAASELQRLGHREVLVERAVLRDEADARKDLERLPRRVVAEDANGAGGGPQQADGEVDHRGLPGSVRADEAGDLPSRQLDIAVVQRLDRSEAFGERGRLNDGVHGCSPLVRTRSGMRR